MKIFSQLNSKSMNNKFFYTAILALGLVSCTNDPQGASKVSGRVSGGSSASNVSSQTVRSNVSSVGVEGATVIMAEVQTDGSLKTVSTQSVQTDVNGNFVVETNTSSAKNLVVVATKGSSEWQSVVSAEVKSGKTVYAQPLNSESTAEAEVYARLVATGKTNVVSQADVQLYLNSDIAAQIKGNVSLKDQFISSLEARSQASSQACSNSNYGITSSQIQTITDAKVQAQVSFETALYNSSDSISAATAFVNYQKAIVSAYVSANVNAETYAKISKISSQAYLNASSSMSSQLSFACAKSEYMRDAFVIQQAMEAKFQSAGATSLQSSAVVTAGASLSTAVKSSVNSNQIANAFAQYHSSIVDQLKLTLNTQATAINSIDASINGFSGIKLTLNAAIGVGVSTNAIVDAYVIFYNSIKVLVQASLSGASSSQISASTDILILANVNS